MASLKARFRFYAIVLLLPLQLVVTLASYAYVSRTGSRLVDASLRSEAEALAQQGCASRSAAQIQPQPRLASSSRRARTAFQCWGSDNRLISGTPEFAAIALDGIPAGFASRDIGDQHWRIYTALADGTWIRVGSRSPMISRYGEGAALQLLVVAGIGLPLALLAIGAAVSRALAPVDALAEDIARRSPDDTTPLGPGELPRELEPVVAAVNALMRKCATRARVSKAV